MKNSANMTLSLPKRLIARLHKVLPKGQISCFTAAALDKALDEIQEQNDRDLENAYAKAFADKTRELEAREWGEMGSDQVEGWEWYEE